MHGIGRIVVEIIICVLCLLFEEGFAKSLIPLNPPRSVRIRKIYLSHLYGENRRRARHYRQDQVPTLVIYAAFCNYLHSSAPPGRLPSHRW